VEGVERAVATLHDLEDGPDHAGDGHAARVVHRTAGAAIRTVPAVFDASSGTTVSQALLSSGHAP
jgi:hypothetical protein